MHSGLRSTGPKGWERSRIFRLDSFSKYVPERRAAETDWEGRKEEEGSPECQAPRAHFTEVHTEALQGMDHPTRELPRCRH